MAYFKCTVHWLDEADKVVKEDISVRSAQDAVALTGKLHERFPEAGSIYVEWLNDTNEDAGLVGTCDVMCWQDPVGWYERLLDEMFYKHIIGNRM